MGNLSDVLPVERVAQQEPYHRFLLLKDLDNSVELLSVDVGYQVFHINLSLCWVGLVWAEVEDFFENVEAVAEVWYGVFKILAVVSNTVVFDSKDKLFKAQQVNQVLRGHFVTNDGLELRVVNCKCVVLGRLTLDASDDFNVVGNWFFTTFSLLLAKKMDEDVLAASEHLHQLEGSAHGLLQQVFNFFVA